MQITVPIYVHTVKASTGVQYIAAPLFHNVPQGPIHHGLSYVNSLRRKRGDELGRLLASLAGDLRRFATDAARDMTNDQLFDLHQPEALDGSLQKLVLDLKDKTAALKLLLVSFSRNGTRFGFSPSLPNVWFEIGRGESVEGRAVEVYQDFLRKQRAEDPSVDPARFSVPGKAWLDSIVLSIPRLPVRKPKPQDNFAALFGLDVSDGAEQLSQVGRCLDALDIDDLAEPLGVEAQMRELDVILSMNEPKCVALVGPSGSGKTALIQGWVRQRKLKQAKPRIKKLVYELAASRLISGMSYLGQWESRVTGILEFSHRMNHVLYFSDFLGLYRAGVTRDSKYSVADLIRGQRERRPVRLIAELTDEAWTILRERDPGLASHFTVIRMNALDESQSLPVLIAVMRGLEMKHRCKFGLETLPEIVRLYDRFVRDSVLPGKAIDAMQRLAVTKAKDELTVEDVWDEFHRRTGLARRLIDRKHKLDRGRIETSLQARLIGQPEAVRAMADRVVVTAARMNETSRPLGVLMFLGPTGVGKTEAAKCIAEYLYGEGGLLRIDMNELSGPTAAATMLGTFDAPEGRLTGAVRQRPFCVILLDEIEKAHPAVLDVLLQALGEARMTDALGRTVDLSGTVMIMTSNLGADEARRRVGFAGGEDAEKHIRLKAVRDFFRPEFVNRIDQIIHFGSLNPADVRKIASLQLEHVLRRDGLIRRRTILDVDPRVVDWTVQQGFDATQGARAIKRALERYLVDAAAPQLVALDASLPHLVQIRPGVHQPLDVKIQELREIPSQPQRDPVSPQATLVQAKEQLKILEKQLPRGSTSIVAGSSRETILEFTLRDAFRGCCDEVRNLAKLLEPSDMTEPVAIPSIKPVKRLSHGYGLLTRVFTELNALDDMKAFLRDALTKATVAESDQAAETVRRSLNRLQKALQCDQPFVPGRLVLRSFGSQSRAGILSSDEPSSHENVAIWIEQGLEKYFSQRLGIEVKTTTEGQSTEVLLNGVLSLPLAEELAGACMWIKPDGSIQLVDITCGEEKSVRESTSESQSDSQLLLRYLGYSGGPLVDLKSGVAVDCPNKGHEEMITLFARFWEAISNVA